MGSPESDHGDTIDPEPRYRLTNFRVIRRHTGIPFESIVPTGQLRAIPFPAFDDLNRYRRDG
jgi:hypothetical protein